MAYSLFKSYHSNTHSKQHDHTVKQDKIHDTNLFRYTCGDISTSPKSSLSGSSEDNQMVHSISVPYGASRHTVQITFIFIGQTHLVFGKRVCTCVMKHSNAFRTFLNWLKNSKRVWHERKLHIMRVPLFANFDR